MVARRPVFVAIKSRRGPRLQSLGAAFLMASALFAGARAARADVSSWLFVGTGPSWLERSNADLDDRWSFQLETGMGTPPSDALVFGGLGRVHTHFGLGTDLALLFRTATRSFVGGSWGGALDLGPYRRFWGEGSTGATGSLVLGAPWGITLSLGASVGTNEARTFSGVLGIDLARLTVYRTAGQSWWVNPFPPTSGEPVAPR